MRPSKRKLRKKNQPGLVSRVFYQEFKPVQIVSIQKIFTQLLLSLTLLLCKIQIISKHEVVTFEREFSLDMFITMK